VDNYQDVTDRYIKRLEQIILDAGLTLPDCWGNGGGERRKK
jgi:hypothetical protein